MSKSFHIAIKYDIFWLARLLLSGHCENLSELFPEDDVIYTAGTRLSFFLNLMQFHEMYQLAFDEPSIPLAIATAGDSALYHMKRYYDSGHRRSPCSGDFLAALARSESCLHKSFEFLIDRGFVTFLHENIIGVALSNELLTPKTMDMLLSRGKLTTYHIYEAAKNKWELAWHLIKRNEVKISVEVLMAILDDKSVDPYKLKGLLDHLSHFRNIDISQKVVQIVDGQWSEVRLPFMDALIRQTDQVSIDPEAARLISRFFPIAFTKILLERHDITIDGLVGALEGSVWANNNIPILDLIFKHLEKSVLTEDVIRDAVSSNMLHSLVNRYARECQGLCRIFLPQTGAEQTEALHEQIRVAKISRKYDGAVVEYIMEHSTNTPITDGIMTAAAGLSHADVIAALHEHRAKHQVCNLPIPLELFIAVTKNPSAGALGILKHLIGLDDRASMTDELLNTMIEDLVISTTDGPREDMLGVLLRLKSYRREKGIPDSLCGAAVENHEISSAINVLKRLLSCSHRDWQPSYSLLKTAARKNFDALLILLEHKRMKIHKEDIPEHQAVMKQSMSPEILLAAVGNAGEDSNTPELVHYILQQPGQLEITPDVWITARMNPTYGKKLDKILKEFVSKKLQEPAQDLSQIQDMSQPDDPEEFFLPKDSADSDEASWDGGSELADGEEADAGNEEGPAEEPSEEATEEAG